MHKDDRAKEFGLWFDRNCWPRISSILAYGLLCGMFFAIFIQQFIASLIVIPVVIMEGIADSIPYSSKTSIPSISHSSPEKLLHKIKWILPRKSRVDLLGDLFEDIQEARDEGQPEALIWAITLWQLSIVLLYRIPNFTSLLVRSLLGGTFVSWLLRR